MPILRPTVALVCAALLAGCGEGPRVEYSTQVNAEASNLNAALIAIGTTVSQSADTGAIARQLDRQIGTVSASVERLRRVEPPEGAGRAHAKLVAGVEEYLRTMRRAASVAKEGDLAKLTEVLRSVTDGTGSGAKQIREARDELDEEGFSVSGT